MEELEESTEDPSQQQTLNLAVTISASFPQSEIFGVKMVNGRSTQAVLDISNEEPEPISVALVGGSLWTQTEKPGAPEEAVNLRNLTTQRYGITIPPGEKETLTYAFATEMHPQELRLNIAAVLQNNQQQFFTKLVYNETVSIVEAPMSFFDPQV